MQIIVCMYGKKIPIQLFIGIKAYTVYLSTVQGWADSLACVIAVCRFLKNRSYKQHHTSHCASLGPKDYHAIVVSLAGVYSYSTVQRF